MSEAEIATLNSLADRIEKVVWSEHDRGYPERLGIEVNEALEIASYITDEGNPVLSIDAAMALVQAGMELAIYTNWALTEGQPQNPDGSRTITDVTPRGCWVRAYGGSEAGPIKNVRGMAHTIALAVAAIALRIRAATTA